MGRRDSRGGHDGDALSSIHSAPPAIAIVDLRLPDGDGTQVIKALTAYAPGCRSVVLTMSRTRLVRAALNGGAAGYLLKGHDPGGTHRRDPDNLRRGVVLRPPAAQEEREDPGGPFRLLTPREVRIAVLVATGAANPRSPNGCGSREDGAQPGLGDRRQTQGQRAGGDRHTRP